MKNAQEIHTTIDALKAFVSSLDKYEGRTLGRVSDEVREEISKASVPFSENASGICWFSPTECVQYPKGKVPFFTLAPAHAAIERLQSMLDDDAKIQAMPEFSAYLSAKKAFDECRRAFDNAARLAGISSSRLTHYA